MKVMKVTQLKLTVYTVIRKWTNFLLYIPKTLFRTWLQIQIKIVCFPFCFVPAILRLISWRNSAQQHGPPPASGRDRSLQPRNIAPALMEEPYLEPRSEDIIRQVKRLRNSMAMSITHFTGEEVFTDVPILRQKVTRFSEACIEGDVVKIAEAKKVLEEHPPVNSKSKSNEDYYRITEEPARETEHPVTNRLPKLRLERKMNIRKSANKNGGNEIKLEASNMLKTRKRVAFIDVCNKETGNLEQEEGVNVEHRHDMRLSLQNRRLRNQLFTTNSKLEDLLKSSNKLLVEVGKLNGQFRELTTVSSKISNLECELNAGKKILREIEEERNEMKLKLLALEQMIKEEEDFLDDLSCESGYEEVENICDSHDEL